MKRTILANLTITTAAVFVLLPATSLAVPLLTSGMRTQQSAGAGQTQSRGGGAVMHNPANLLRTSGIRAVAEFTLLNLSHTYTPAEEKFPITEVKTTQPPVAAGGSMKPGNFAMGFMFVPLGSGSELEIEKVPMQVGDSLSVMDIAVKSTLGYEAGIGAAWGLRGFSLGFSLINTFKRETLRAEKDGSELLNTEYEGSFFRPLIGTRMALTRNFILALTYRPSQVRKYTGTTLYAGTELDKLPVEYAPETIGTGITGHTKIGSFFLDGQYEKHAAGRTVKRGAVPTKVEETDLIDAWQVSLGSRLRPGLTGHSIVLAAGYATGSMGDGEIYQNDAGYDMIGVIGGGTFGDFEAISRRTLAAGWTRSWKSVDLNAMGQHMIGRRIVPYDSAGEGLYELETWSLGVGMDYKL